MVKSEHNPELVERLAQMHEGNAAAHLKLATEQQYERKDGARSRWTGHQMVAASALVIAASYWSLVDVRKAVSLYRFASKVYRDLGHDYWMVLALISSDANWTAALLSAVDEMRTPTPQAVAFAMVSNEAFDAGHRGRRAERLVTQWRHIGNHPVGRLGIPLDYYGRCAQAMQDARERKNPRRFLGEAMNYVHRAAEVVRSASHDRFHWSRLESTILPAEPEAVAMTTAISTMSRVFQVSITEMPNLDDHGRLLVEIGDEIWRVNHHEDEPGR